MGNLAFLLTDRARGFVEACYERGDLAATLAYVDREHASCFGYDASLQAFSIRDLGRLLDASCAFARRVGSRIVSHECHLAYRGEGCAVVLSSLRLRGTAEKGSPEYVRRLTFVFAPADGDWPIVHMHSSATEEGADGREGPAGITLRDVGELDVDAMLSQVKMERERYEIVAELSDDVIYEYDALLDSLYLFSTRFGGSPGIRRNKVVIEHCTSTLDPATFVHPDDLERYKADSRVLSGELPGDGLQGDAYSFVYRLRPAFSLDEAQGGRAGYVHQRVLGRRVLDRHGLPVKYVGKIVDVSEEYELMQQSTTDALTGAYNRSYLQSRLHDYCASKQPDVSYACLLADVDCFKSVNDRFGHLAGDDLLVAFVDTARTLFRASDVVARLGGDEFMVLMRDVYDPQVAGERSEALIEAFHRVAGSRGFPDDVSLSIGLVVSREPRSFSDLYHCADIALYHAKGEGKSRAVAYSEGMRYPQGAEPGRHAVRAGD